MARVMLVDRYDTTQSFELTFREARDLLDADAVTFCLADSFKLEDQIGFPVVAVHPSVDEKDAFGQFIEVIESVRRTEDAASSPDHINPMTGGRMGVIHIVPRPNGGNLN